MKEDNEHYSATKESLKKTIKELRETVSHIYYIPVFVYLKLIVSNEEKMQKWTKFHYVRWKKNHF